MDRSSITETDAKKSNGDKPGNTTEGDTVSQTDSITGTRRGTMKRIASVTALSSLIVGGAGINTLQPVSADSFDKNPEAYESYWKEMVEEHGEISSLEFALRNAEEDVYDEENILLQRHPPERLLAIETLRHTGSGRPRTSCLPILE